MIRMRMMLDYILNDSEYIAMFIGLVWGTICSIGFIGLIYEATKPIKINKLRGFK